MSSAPQTPPRVRAAPIQCPGAPPRGIRVVHAAAPNDFAMPARRLLFDFIAPAMHITSTTVYTSNSPIVNNMYNMF